MGLGIELVIGIGAVILVSLGVKLLVDGSSNVGRLSALVIVEGGKASTEVLVTAIDIVEPPASVSCRGEMAMRAFNFAQALRHIIADCKSWLDG